VAYLVRAKTLRKFTQGEKRNFYTPNLQGYQCRQNSDQTVLVQDIAHRCNVCNVVLERDGGDQLDWSCEKWASVTNSKRIQECPVDNKTVKLAYWSNVAYEPPSETECWRKDSGKGRSEGKKGRTSAGRNKGIRSYGPIKEEIIHRTVWRTGCRRGCGLSEDRRRDGPLDGRTNEWMDGWMNERMDWWMNKWLNEWMCIMYTNTFWKS